MKRCLLFVALLAFSSVAPAYDHEGPGRDIDKVNGSITASAGETYGDLSTVNGGIDLERGARVRDVETVNGGIEAADDVGAHSVSTVNGASTATWKPSMAASSSIAAATCAMTSAR